MMATQHAWVHARQERPGEISLLCACGLAWKHHPLPYGTGANLPGCPDSAESAGEVEK